MQLPKRKPGQYADVKPDYYVTPAEIKKLEQELDRLLKVSRPKAIIEMQGYAELGDFSENHPYQMAKAKLRGMNNRIDLLQSRIGRAIPIETGPSADGSIQIGSMVVLSINGRERTYQILGSQETNPREGKISYLSPLGAALLGHVAGDEVSVEIDEKKVPYTILEVR